jgi:mannosyltransferase
MAATATDVRTSLTQRRDARVMLWVIVAVAALLRLWALNGKSFWLDEIASVVIARMPGNSFWHWLWTEEGNMALYYVMLRPWLDIHLGEGTVRLLSVLPGIASVPLMYAVGVRLFGRRAGLLSAVLLAISTCAVVYSQEARGYSWLLLGTLLSTYLFVRLIENPSFALAFAYGLAAGATFYFHYFGLLVPVAHAVSLAALPNHRRPWKQLGIGGTLIVLIAIPVLWMIHIQPVRHLDWVQPPSLLEFYHLGVFLAAESGKGVGPVLLVLELVLIAVFLRQMLLVMRKSGDYSLWPYALVASGLLTPIFVSLVVSVVRPVFFHRFLIICLPSWLLVCAVGTMALRERRLRMWAIAGTCLLSLVSTAISYSRAREDWRGVANYLIDNASAQDVVLYYRGVGNFAAESYRNWLPGGNANRPRAIEIIVGSGNWREQIAGARRVWLVEYPDHMEDVTARTLEAELHSRYSAVASNSFRAVTVTEFEQKR